MINGREDEPFQVKDTLGNEHEMVLIQEMDSNVFFALDASYLEQNVGPVISPYKNGTVIFSDGIDDGSKFETDVLIEQYGDERGSWGAHPLFPKDLWQHEVINDETVLGYWEWVGHQMEIEEGDTA